MWPQKRSRRRCLTVLLVANYLLAISSAALLHNHGIDGCRAHGGYGVCSQRGESGHGQWHSCEHGRHAPESSDEAPPARCPPDPRCCPACRLLADKPMPVADAEQVASAPLEVELVPAVPLRPGIGISRIWWSRAPPTLA